MKPRKVLGGATEGGDFGCKSIESMSAGQHPDHAMGTGEKPAMKDGERGIGGGIQHTKGMMPAQAAPNHGPHSVGGYNEFSRDGKA